MALAEVKKLPSSTDYEVVSVLERMLERAKNGEILALSCLEFDGAGTAYYTTTGIQDRFKASGALYHLLWKLQQP